MSQTNHCPECGAELSPSVPKGLCSHCALTGALEAEHAHDDVQPLIPPMLPRRFGDYELLEEIARGGMGVVYKARQVSLGRIVAVKMLLLGPHANPEYIRRFRIEASAAAALQHPNIVAIHEVGVHDGEQFLVMDYIDGPSLAKLMKEQPLPAKRAAEYLRTIAEAIDYAHERGILHRDLKPSNILIDSNDQPHVTDFGLAKRIVDADQSMQESSHLTLSGHILGSPAYMSPEQALGKRSAVGRRSDVYSLGAMLYHLLAGHPPFLGESIAETLRNIETQEAVSPRLLNPKVPHDLETICLKCLEKDPHRRYATGRELAQDLERFIRRQPIDARPIGLLSRTSRWTRRNPAGAALIAALFLGIAILLGQFKVVNDHRRSEQDALKIMRSRLSEDLDELWVRDDKPSETITSEELAALLGRSKSMPGTNEVRLRIGVGISMGPVRRAERLQPLLDFLEQEMEHDLRRPVRLDLKLYKPGRLNIKAIVDSDCDITRLGAVSYARARQINPGVIPLVQESIPRDAAIFARRDLGITNVSQLKDHSFAFGDKDATLSAWAKGILARAGLRATNLSHFVLLDSHQQIKREIKEHGIPSDLTEQFNSHKEVIKAVCEGRFDAGVAREKNIAKFLGNELVTLQKFNSSPDIWAGRSGLADEVCHAFRDAMVSVPEDLMRDVPIGTEAFFAVRSSMQSELERLLKDVAAFEGETVLADSSEGDLE